MKLRKYSNFTLGIHTVISNFNVDEFEEIYEELMKLDFKIAVPGHGQLASKEQFSIENKYIKEILDLVKKHIDAGEDPSQIKREDFSKELQSFNSPLLERNIIFLTEFLKKT